MEAVHGRLVGRGAEQALQQLPALALGQALQPEYLGHSHPIQVSDQLGGPAGGGVGVGAEADEEEEGGGSHGPHQVADQLDAVVVGPLQVVEHQEQGTLPGEGEDGGGHLVEGAQHLLLGGEAFHVLAPSRDSFLRCLELLSGPGFPGDGGHLGRGEQGAKEEERSSKLFVGGHVEDEERLFLLGGQLGGGLQHPGLADAGLTLEHYRGEPGGRGGQQLLIDRVQFLGPSHHRALGPSGTDVEGGS